MKLLESSTSEGENSITEVVEQDEKKIEVPKKDFLKAEAASPPFQTHRRVEPWGRLQDPATDELPIDWEAAG